MAKYNSELDVKKALGIESFRGLSKDNVMRFAALMPDMDKEVALKIVEQFPEFKAFAMDAMNVIQQSQEAALAGNAESQRAVHDAWTQVREILKGQLTDEDMPWEQRKYILDLIMETARQAGAKDSENKFFLRAMNKDTAMAVGAVVALGLIFVGGRLGIERFSGDSRQDD